MEELLLDGSLGSIHRAIAAKKISVNEIARWYLARIEALDGSGPKLNAIRTIAPDALDVARQLDNEVASGRIRGPLHGVPIILKDNIMTGDGMTAAAGAAALAGFKPAGDATLARRLRAAGALILGKANLTEFADYVSDVMPSGFSGAGGMVKIRTASSITGAASARAWGRRRQLPHRWRRSPSAARRRTRSKPRPACLQFSGSSRALEWSAGLA